MAIDFPNSPTDGQTFNSGNVIYRFNASRGIWQTILYPNAPTGFTGSIGFVGSSGNLGFAGSIGFTGSVGNSGFTGSVGNTGGTGFTGSQGIQGNLGFTGSIGGIGFTGSVGNTGATGFVGSQGIQGITGFTGSIGNTGGTGFTGSQGIIGFTGSIGIGFTGSIGFVGSRGNTQTVTLSETTPTPVLNGELWWNPNLGTLFINYNDGNSSQWVEATPAVRGFTGSSGITSESFMIAVSDETTPITAGTGKVTFRMPYAFTVSEVRASLKTAQSSGSIFTVDINENGTSILSTKLTIDNTERTSVTAASPPVISNTSLADDSEITVDVDQIGNSTAVGLKISLIGTRT